jgi:alkylation response protein AidB-like acyl-CoA dehydrogenase
MDFRITPEQAHFVAALRAHLDSLDLDAVAEETKANGAMENDLGPSGRQLLRRLGSDGWLAVGWPKEYGGQGRTEVEKWLFLEELAYRRVPVVGMSVASVGPTIMRAGTEDQKRRFLPGILSGEIEFAVGYTEPNAGSDLAAVDTRAVRVADEYVVNGQKTFITSAHCASHIWLCVRTGPREERHRGLSVLVVPLDTPGITVRGLESQAGVRTNEVYFEDVRVPAANLIGRENDGWAMATMALDFERTLAHSGLTRDFEDLVTWAAHATVAGDAVSRQSLAELAVDLDITRLFALRTAWMIEQGEVPNAEASMSKVWLTENIQRVSSGALQLMGEAGQLRHGSDDAPADGYLERRYRVSSAWKFGAGTNEVQRNIIAQRGLGLPR